MTTWLVTGANGMLGSELVRQLREAGEELVALAKSELDVTDRAAVSRAVAEARPGVIVNCAAFTKVDDCETNEELALAVNGSAVGHLAAAANDADALLVQVSTDFVFPGDATEPYGIDAPTAPISAYGRSKLAGEVAARQARRHAVVRTSWVFGPGGPNFVAAIRRQLDLGKLELRVVDDQRGRPTYTKHLAAAIVRIARCAMDDPAAQGMYHYSDSPECTWFDFARAVVEILADRGQLHHDVRVLPVASDEFPRPARRPAYSVLSTERYERVTGAAPERWEAGLLEYLL